MSGRSISGRLRGWLLGEMDLWRGEGILSEDQAARIVGLYETPADISRQKKSLAQFTLMGLAASMIGLAVLLLIGYNWSAMPAAMKLIIIFGTIIGTYAGGFYLRFRMDHRRLSEIAFFLGCLFYGSGIWLVAQVFHVPVHFPTGFWLWALGVLPFALLLDTLLLHLLLTSLLAIWVGTEVIGFPNLGAWLFGRWGMIPNAAYTLPLLALPGLAWAYRRRLPIAVIPYVALLAWWVVLQPIAWHLEFYIVYFIGGVGGLFLLVAECHRHGNPFAVPYRFCGALLAGGALIPLSFYDFHREAFHSKQGVLSEIVVRGLGTSMAIFVLTVATIAVVTVLRRRQTPTQVAPQGEVVPFLREQWLPLGVTSLMALPPVWNVLTYSIPGSALLPTIVANVAMILVSLWLIHVGLRDERVVPFGGGVAYFLLWSLLRYVDLFADAGGMLGAALMFFLCGAALFGVAMFWHQRKAVQHV